jgi:OmpA-OmpF porin, OOP family
MEIGGHTDSQGSEGMNERLSQARADAVLNAIMARRVLTSNLSAKGYGEASPSPTTQPKAGREANRRIEFRLLHPARGRGRGSAATRNPRGARRRRKKRHDSAEDDRTTE